MPKACIAARQPLLPLSDCRGLGRQEVAAEPSSLLARLTADAPGLSPRLKAVALYCLAHARRLHLCRIQEVAEQCHTQPVSVVRLAKRYGFRGFLDFKMAFLEQDTGRPENCAPTLAFRTAVTRLQAAQTEHVVQAKVPGMKTLLCFGDSNTHGTIPMRSREEVSRYGFGQRWPGVVQATLGAAWRVLEEGLPGRTSCFDDPEEGEDRNALRYWQACLQSQRPLDAIVLMLGTNDLKARFHATPERIAAGVKALVEIALQNTPPGAQHPFILVITPTPIRELGFFCELFAGGAAKSLQLADAFCGLAQMPGVQLMHAQDHCVVSAVDGIHLDALAHQQLGRAIGLRLESNVAKS